MGGVAHYDLQEAAGVFSRLLFLLDFLFLQRQMRSGKGTNRVYL